MYTYGYIRVSSRDQNEDRQRIAMREAGVEDARIYMDKQSGKTDCIFRFKKTDCFKATPHNPPSASSGKFALAELCGVAFILTQRPAPFQPRVFSPRALEPGRPMCYT